MAHSQRLLIAVLIPLFRLVSVLKRRGNLEMTFDDNFWDSLSSREGDFVETVLLQLAGCSWIQPLVDKIRENGGVTRKNKDLLFESRFAYALYQAGIQASYEILGEGESTIDFGFLSMGKQWAVELVRLGETVAARTATKSWVDEDGVPWSERGLSTDAVDDRQSTEGETLKAIQRICQKCEKQGRPHKFLVPKGQLNVILVDFRTFLMNASDKHDMLHIALGANFVAAPFKLKWKGNFITGVFDSNTHLRGALEARERVHFVGFVKEENYALGEFGKSICFVANPHLFLNKNEVLAVLGAWPLGGFQCLNLKYFPD